MHVFFVAMLVTTSSASVTGADLATEVDAMMRAYAGEAPGASVLVLHGEAVLLRRSYGMADRQRRVAVTPATNFRLASVTKQFTAAAVLLLVEEGRMSLDDSARRWLPSLPPSADAVTLRHLLLHGSGLIDYEDLMPARETRQVRDAGVLRLLETEHRLYFSPGTGYRYSNSGYALLALVVEHASGMGFPAFLQQRIFQPLGMARTLAYTADGPAIANRAYGYSERDGQWVRTDQSTTSAVLGDGGIYSSVDDLAKWAAALHDDRLLNEHSRKLMFTPHVASDDPDIHYGYGWRITHDSVWHSGETIGFRNVIVRYPAQRLSVVVLTNRDGPEQYEMAKQIAEQVKPHE
jgi:CubicO group peptidase (beta-lactamase class C family)